MGTTNESRAKEIQSINNDIIQESSEKCMATCVNIENGNSAIFDGATIDGNLTGFKQVCKVSTSCVMTEQLNSQIQDVLESVAKQTQQLDSSFLSIFADTHNKTKATIEQSINNSVTQLLNSSCTATASNIQNNDMFVLSNSTVLGGVIAFSQTGNPTASCTMNNLGKIKLFNKEQAEISQEQRIENIFVAIIAMIVAALVIGGILLFPFFGGSLLFGADEETRPTPAPAAAAPAAAPTAAAPAAVAAAPMAAPAEQPREQPAEQPAEAEQKPEEKKEEGGSTTILGNPLAGFFGGGKEEAAKEGEEGAKAGEEGEESKGLFSKVEDNPATGGAGEAGEAATGAGEAAEGAGVAAEGAEAAELAPLILL